MGKAISLATFVEPNIALSNDGELVVTMSKFCEGENPRDIGPEQYSFVLDEGVSRTIGKYWGDFRTQSIEFKS